MAVNTIYLSRRDLEKDETAKFENIPDGIDICNLGSSHGVHGYYYEELEDEYTCFNFALDSQGLYYDSKILNTYKDKLKKGCVVIVDISYFQFWGVGDITAADFLAYNKRYYKILAPEDIVGYDWYTNLIVNDIKCLDEEPKEIIKTIFLNDNNDNKKEIKSYPDIFSVTDEARLGEDTYMSSRRHILDNKRDEHGELIFNAKEMEALEDIVNICDDNDFKLIWVTVPYLSEYITAINEVDAYFGDEFDRMIREKSDELNVNYYDYSCDERFSRDYSLFYNGDHMNTKGAKKFTRILYEEVIHELLEDQ